MDSRLETADKRISKLENHSEENIWYEQQREK